MIRAMLRVDLRSWGGPCFHPRGWLRHLHRWCHGPRIAHLRLSAVVSLRPGASHIPVSAHVSLSSSVPVGTYVSFSTHLSVSPTIHPFGSCIHSLRAHICSRVPIYLWACVHGIVIVIIIITIVIRFIPCMRGLERRRNGISSVRTYALSVGLAAEKGMAVQRWLAEDQDTALACQDMAVRMGLVYRVPLDTPLSHSLR